MLSSSVVACVTSSSEVAPLRKRDSAIAQPLLLDRDVLCGLLDQHLEGADHDVGARDLRGERDERRS